MSDALYHLSFDAAAYDAFLRGKVATADRDGFEVDESEINPILKPFQRAVVRWAVKGGQRGIFARFGLGKTMMQLEVLRLLLARAGGRALIVAPLGVRQEFAHDVYVLATGDDPHVTDAQREELRRWLEGRPDRIPSLQFIRSIEEAGETGLYLTNYETVRDGKLDPRLFTAASLDEASCLRGFGGTKTFREFMRLFAGDGKRLHERERGDAVRYRFVATATPSPNDYIELLAYAAFLGVMDVGQAKAQPLTAKILTPTGWKQMGEIQVGDQVIAGDGTPTRVLGVYPQGEKEIFRVTFSDGSVTECCAEHLWLTRTQYERNNERRYRQRNPDGEHDYWTVKDTAEIARTLTCGSTGSKNHEIPMVGPVQFPARPVAADPWLLGLLLGDGSLRETSVVLSSADEWIVEEARRVVAADGLTVEKLPDRSDGAPSYDYQVSAGIGRGGRGPGSNPLLNALRGYGLLGKRAWEKSIPDEYLYNTPDVRLAVLQGLMDADGTVDANGTVRFTTTSLGLLGGVVFLVRSLGGTVLIRKGMGRTPLGGRGRLWWRVTVRLPDEFNPFRLPRKAERVQSKEKYRPVRYITAVDSIGSFPAQCIAVEHPSRLYVTDNFVVTHNTRFFKRDSEKADHLTLHPHKEEEFWHWIASWGLFLQKPSDLGPYSDEGYELPPLDVRWHEIPVDHGAAAGAERDGQRKLFADATVSVQNAAKVKRDTLPERVAKMMELRAEDPDAHRILWHDLEKEREAIERAVPGVVSVYGSQDLEEREAAIVGFSAGRIPEVAGKPVMLGSGCNFQRHCAWAIYLGIGFKFNDFIQSVHRLWRFLQTRAVRIDLIYSEAERGVRRRLEEKWRRHDELMERMGEIIREYGLSEAALASTLERSMGVERVEVSGPGYRLAHNDCVLETARMEDASVHLVVTSLPFATQYEYTPSYNDFGHTDHDAHFWRQMDFLLPQLYRVLAPGRIAAIHVKDRIIPGGMTGLGFQTSSTFHCDTIYRFKAHGFAFLGMKTITTDVVRENNQTYRLGWTEQCKDGSKMGCGMPEYLLLFRKPPTDRSNGYADEPVRKAKKLTVQGEDGTATWENPDGYSRARWQLDAHGFMRSRGDRPLTPEEVIGQPADVIYRLWRAYSVETVYDFEEHVAIGEALEAAHSLPPTFMLLPPPSWHPDVWSDVARMRTLNSSQAARRQEMHLCPLQFDIVDRAIAQFSMPGETVYDPFGGVMTVPVRALKLGRRGEASELNPQYFRDGVEYVRAMAAEKSMPSLFDLLEAEASAEVEEEVEEEVAHVA